MRLLQVSSTNKKFRKLDKSRKVYSMSLLSGHTCIFARECKASVLLMNGARRVVDGDQTVFRCFSASQEAQYPETYQARLRNTALVKKTYKNGDVEDVADLIEDSLVDAIPKKHVDGDDVLIRPHIGGGFFALWYFDAWLIVARRRPNWRLYAYLKALPFWVKRMDSIPDNFRLIASRGGTHDHLIAKHKLREALVVYSEDSARKLGLEIDKDDTIAAYGEGSFALLIHSTQPKGSTAARAVARNRASR